MSTVQSHIACFPLKTMNSIAKNAKIQDEKWTEVDEEFHGFI